MSADPTGTEVFEEIDPDPDAVLAEFDAESPDDLLETGGVHDPVPDDEIDVDDTTAAELFDGLADVDAEDRTDRRNDEQADEVDEQANEDDPIDEDDLGFEFIGNSDVTVREDGDVIESTAAELSALAAAESNPAETINSDENAEISGVTGLDRTTDAAGSSGTLTVRAGSADELELVGPEPTPTRITNDAFSGAGFDAR